MRSELVELVILGLLWLNRGRRCGSETSLDRSGKVIILLNMNRVNMGLMAFVLGSGSAFTQSLGALSPYSKTPELSQMSRPDTFAPIIASKTSLTGAEA